MMPKKVTGTARITLFALVAALALSLSSCETLAAAFADQVGRNIADSLWDK